MAKKLRSEGGKVTRYQVMMIESKSNLQVKRRVVYKLTAKRKHSDAVAANLLNKNFNSVGQNQVWCGKITYL